MQIVVAAYSLAGSGGLESYAVTVADHLQRLGHDVWLHSVEDGRATDAARSLGVRVATDERELPREPDALLAQDGIVACELAARYPSTPQVVVVHSDIFDMALPPRLPGLVAAVVVLYDRVERRLRALAEPAEEIVRLTQPIDVERFKPTQPLRPRPQVAMTLGNYIHGERVALLQRACERAGIELRHVGQYGEGQRPSELVLNDADIVFGKARVIAEAMACGRAAYVFDHNGGDGWVTGETYPQLVADNFGGQSLPGAIDEDRLVADLATYDAGMGVVNRDLIVVHHAATKHAAALADILARIARTPRAVPVDAPLREMARLIRLYHRADAQAFAMRAETAAFAERAQAWEQRAAALEAELAAASAREALAAERLSAAAARASAEVASATAEADAQRAEAAVQRADAARLARLLTEVTTSRRWRALQIFLAPADRLRRAARGARRVPADRRRAARGARRAPADRLRRAGRGARRMPTNRRAARGSRRPPAGRPAPPAPFVVGVPRSGTTLLRLQLDSHPELAIGPESGFGVVASRPGADAAGRAELLDALIELDTWSDLGLDRAAAERALERAQPWSLGNGLRALYAALAARAGKPRWGDKTPVHSACMPALAAALPEARFIHLIRDGRDVAASVRDLPFAPGDGSIEAIAADWRDRIVAARRDALALAHYREVRYERLVGAPEDVLRELCEFLDLEFDAAMLRAHERAAEALARLPERRPEGGSVATRSERIARHAHLLDPPDPSRAGRWRTALTADEVARFEAVAGDLLAELGYEPAATATRQPVP